MLSFVAALLLIAPQSDTGRLGWVPNPRATSGSWVADPARHLRPATVARLDSIAGQLERETTAELAIVVLDSLDGLEPGDAALRLHRRWGVGKANRDNGLVLLWSPALRKIQVSVGYGLEGAIPDARAGRVQDEAMLPAFRRGDFDAGMIAGAAALAAAAREETYSGLERSQAARPAAGLRVPRGAGAIASLVGAVAGIPLLIVGAFKARRYRPRKCPRGHGRLRRLDESSDDALLAKEEVLEETLSSVDYDVWVCDRCDYTLVLPYKRWTSRYEDCPQCKRRTCEKTETVLVKPTYTSTGTKRVRSDCKNCSHNSEQDVTMPVLQRSSSGGGGWSSGGGGGGRSFGGGSSGGGGAGRSY